MYMSFHLYSLSVFPLIPPLCSILTLHLSPTSLPVPLTRPSQLSMLAHGMYDINAEDADEPLNRDTILSAMGGDVQRLLHAQVGTEHSLLCQGMMCGCWDASRCF